MVFSSLPFLFLFLPAFLAGFAALRRLGKSAVVGWIALTSCIFYSIWNPWNLLLLALAMGVTFGFGCMVAHNVAHRSKFWLAIGIIFNVALIGWFKYRHFLIGDPAPLILPLGISFIVFQKIAWLVDVSKGRAAANRPFEFIFFVTFFPQLIAGPIVHYRELVPQIYNGRWPAFDSALFTSGIFLFALGLAKKVMVADQIAPMVNQLYGIAQSGSAMTGWQACAAGLGYGLQLYFDFSGYADMALGLAAMVGLRLPTNFNSPYRATSIIDFWRRWHMTLSHWLRDYLFIPLGGSRNGFLHHMANLMVTMLIGGLWHGAAWTFVIWGGLHGILLVIAHAWRRLKLGGVPSIFGWFLTFVCVSTLWVLFRAQDISTALHIYAAIGSGWDPPNLSEWSPWTILLAATSGQPAGLLLWLPLGCFLAVLPYNSNALANFDNLDRRAFSISLLRGIASGLLIAACLRSLLRQPSTEFLYFAF